MGAGAASLRGEFHVDVVDAGTLRWTAIGAIDLDVLLGAFREAESRLAGMNPIVDCFCDMLLMDGFAPSTPIRGLRWAQEHRKRIGRIAIATRSTSFIAVTRTFSLIAPELSVALVADFNDAIAYFASMRGAASRERRESRERAISRPRRGDR